MPKKIEYRLTEAEIKEIKEAVQKEPRAEVRQRANVVRLLHEGYKPAEIAELLLVKVSSVYNWHKRWREGGIKGLANKPKSGRPKLGRAQYCAKVEEIIKSDPSEFGYGFTIWTAQRLIEHLAQETGITMSENTFREGLKTNGYVYRRPKHDLASLQEPEAKRQAADMIEMLKKKAKKAKSNFSLWTKQP